MLQTNCFYNKRRYFWLQGDVIGDKAGGLPLYNGSPPVLAYWFKSAYYSIFYFLYNIKKICYYVSGYVYTVCIFII